MSNYKRERSEKKGTWQKENLPYKPRATDGPRQDSKDTSILAEKSMKDLRFGSIKVAGDPYTSPIGSDSPYPLVTVKNKIYDAQYKGVPNLNGNVLIAVDNPANARLMNMCDAATTEVVINYLYVNRPDDPSQGMNFLLGNTIDQALSVLDAKLVRELAFVTDHWETNLQNIDSENRLAPMVYGQACYMNIAQAVQAYNTAMSIREEVMGMSFMREAPILRSLYAMLVKSSVRDQVNLAAANLPGTYMDMEWFNSVSAAVALPSRKANDKLDPLLNIIATHWLPEVREYRNWDGSSGTKVFDSSDVKVTITTSYFGTVTYDTQTLSSAIQRMLSPSEILLWARQAMNGTSAFTAQQYQNDIVRLFQGMQTLASKVSDYMSVVNTIYTYLSDTTGAATHKNGIVKLTNDNGFVADTKSTVQVAYSKITADLFKGVTCGPTELIWDENTASWMFYSLWDRYYGIPEYEKMSGGAFLTFSLRTVPARADGETGIEQKYQFPILFTADGKAKFVNRNGKAFTITKEVLDADAIKNNNRFARLQLGDYGLASLAVPYYDWEKAALVPLEVSWLNETLLAVYGMSHQHRDDTVVIGDNSVNDYDMESSIVGTVDMEQVTVANSMVTFARSKAPIMVQYLGTEGGSIGFR